MASGPWLFDSWRRITAVSRNLSMKRSGGAGHLGAPSTLTGGCVDHYILDGKYPKKVSLKEWALWFESHYTHERIVARTEWYDAETDENVTVSTVFLGLDHQFLYGPPLLFETMIFGGEHDQEHIRYTTWYQAERGHKTMVDYAKGGVTSE